MAEVKWIKITTTMFDDEKIRIIETMPEADAILVIWIKLLALCGKCNAGGYVYMSERIPYTDEMLTAIFNRPLNTVRLAIKTFEQFGMIEIDNLGIYLVNWEKHQNIDGLEKIREQTKLRVTKHREKTKQLTESNVTVTLRNATDKDIDKDIDKDKKNIPTSKKKYGEYKHVLLKEEEVEKLNQEYGQDLTQQSITFLDEYIQMKGYKAKDHYLAIKKWVIDAINERQKKTKQPTTKFQNFEQDKPDFNEMMRQAMQNRIREAQQ